MDKRPFLIDKDRFFISQLEYKEKVPRFLEVKGLSVEIPLKGDEYLDLFVHETITSDREYLDTHMRYTISEGKTGMDISHIETIEEASSAVIDILNYHREIGNPEAISEGVEMTLQDKCRLSPRYE